MLYNILWSNHYKNKLIELGLRSNADVIYVLKVQQGSLTNGDITFLHYRPQVWLISDMGSL